MNGRQFLVTAHLLKHSGSVEADYRSAISRAYYACFITTRDLALSTCLSVSRKKAGRPTHTSLQQYLKDSPTDYIRRLGEGLAGLCANRHRADYIMHKTLTITEAQDAIEEAEAFLELLSNSPKGDIGKAMDDFQRKNNP